MGILLDDAKYCPHDKKLVTDEKFFILMLAYSGKIAKFANKTNRNNQSKLIEDYESNE